MEDKVRWNLAFLHVALFEYLLFLCAVAPDSSCDPFFLYAVQQTELFTNLMEATPPRGDPIYTEMIGTLGLFGTFYMSKEDMDFCAMRLYSNFKQAQENMERHAILDSIDVGYRRRD